MTLPGAQNLVQRWNVLLQHTSLFGRFSHYFYVYVDSEPVLFFLRSHAEWRSCAQPMPQIIARACAARTQNPEFLRAACGWQFA